MKSFKKVLKNLFFKLPVFMLCWLLASCEKFVEVELPNSQLTGSSVFKDVSTANAAVAHLYVLLRDEGLVSGNSSGMSVSLGYYSDELVHYGTNISYYYLNGLLASDFDISNKWNQCYNLIYAANSVLEGLETATTITPQDRDNLRGEALFIRAYVHFYLLNLYGAIPYVTSTDYQKNMRLPKQSSADVYKAIITDLLKARTDLPDLYISAERVRVNRSVANAMLARVYLYTENWDAAEKAADAVISKTDLYKWVDDLNKVFLNNSSGTLWQLMPRNEGVNTLEASNFIFTSGPPSSLAINPVLMNAFETGDLRKSLWIGSVSKGSDTWYFPYKYKENNATEVSKEYSILFRLEEMYFIRAESYARSGDFIKSAADLNKIRNRAGLGNTTAEIRPDLLAAILKERRVELFSELGHRWFDLKRTGQANAALSGVKPGWDLKDILWPLPENELRLNPNLAPQNTGY